MLLKQTVALITFLLPQNITLPGNILVKVSGKIFEITKLLN